MNSDQNTQSLVYADGYSYTEIFEAPETRGLPDSQLISVFHAFFATDLDFGVIEEASDAGPCLWPAQRQSATADASPSNS